MKFLTFILFFCLIFPALSQEEASELPNVQNKTYKGYYYFHTVEDGDSTLMLVLNPITCFPEEKFKNKKQEEFYWRTVRDVKKALPYAKLIAATLIETYEYIETLPTRGTRRPLESNGRRPIQAIQTGTETLFQTAGESACKTNIPRDKPTNLRNYQSILRRFPRHILASIRKTLWSKPESRMETRQRS